MSSPTLSTPRTRTGVPLAYGWDADGAVVEEQAEQLRESARRIVHGGSSFSAEARRLTQAGQGTWYPAGVSRALLHPRIVGDRAAVRGKRPAGILSRALYDALTDAADQRHRARTGRPTSTLAGLLAGLVYCGRCGAGLRLGGPRENRAYRCPRGRRLGEGRVSCGRTQINARGLEEYVVARALDSWAIDCTPYRAAGPPQVRELDAELLDLATAAGHLEDQYRAGLLHAEEYQRLTARSAARQADLRERRAAAAAAGLPSVRGERVRAWWESASDAERRALVGAVYPSIRVSPATRPGRGRAGEAIDPARVSLREPVPLQMTR